MTDILYQSEGRVRSTTDWSAIWAGLFTFVAIWSVFGVLGFAIFTSTANAGAASATGLAIWAIILTAVAMYIAGRETGRLAGLDGRYESLAHGMIMFGVSIAAAFVLTMSGRVVFFSGVTGTTASAVLSLFGGSGWGAFFALFLGWLAAMLGSSTGSVRRLVAAVPATGRETNVTEVRIRPAA
jgi:hypothetical protein